MAAVMVGDYSWIIVIRDVLFDPLELRFAKMQASYAATDLKDEPCRDG